MANEAYARRYGHGYLRYKGVMRGNRTWMAVYNRFALWSALRDTPFQWMFFLQTALLRAGATIPFNIDILINDEPSALPYLERIQRAGGFRKYETLVTKSLARIFIPKFPQLPAEVIPTIVQFWAHVGDY